MKKIRLTFTVPEDIFQRFATVVPSRTRSAIVSTLLEEEAKRREMTLAAACDAANADAGLAELEADFQALENTVSEPFDHRGW
ncbi:MAG: hypothetical protein HY711_10195 [Candidatus Melainabacteria bacterium]|nr:hypothetical protein [Candidatus Melainabacteria bacterium]